MIVPKKGISFPEQLWRYTNENRLESKSGMWKYHDKKWSIPKDGDRARAGVIKDQQTLMVLSLPENKSEVRLNTVDQNQPLGQKWRRNKANSDGWFTLLNPGSNELLTVASAETLIISGKSTSKILYQTKVDFKSK